MGPPGDADRQRAVLTAALGLLESATEAPTLYELGESWEETAA